MAARRIPTGTTSRLLRQRSLPAQATASTRRRGLAMPIAPIAPLAAKRAAQISIAS
jgi:hypothetical protein